MTCLNSQFVKFVPNNILTTADLSATTQVNYPIANCIDTRHSYAVLGEPDPAYPASSYVAVPDINIEATWDSLQRSDHIGFFWGNLSVGATLRLRLYIDDSFATLVYDSGATQALQFKTLLEVDWLLEPLITPLDYPSNLGKNTDWAFDSTLFQSAKLDISNPTNTSGYINVGTIYLGSSFVTQNVNIVSSSIQIIDQSALTTSSDGSAVPERNTNIAYQVGIDWESLDVGDRTLIEDNVLYSNSTHTPLMIDFHPSIDYAIRQKYFGIFYLTQQPTIPLDSNLLSGIGLQFQRA